MIYLDYNATAPLRPAARTAMLDWLGPAANPSSVHRAGQAAAAAVERARHQVAALLARPVAGIVFTSGATEANHLALHGLAARHPGQDIAVSAVEHPCVHAAARATGRTVHTVSVDEAGQLGLAGLPSSVGVLSVMAVNHETGLRLDLPAARAWAAEHGAALHIDAVQAVGRLELDLDADAVVFSSHKIGGPAGVGCLSLRDGTDFAALQGGGSQERGRRAGTLNVAGIVGFGVACELVASERSAESRRQQALSERLRAGLAALGARVVGRPSAQTPGTTCAVFPGIDGQLLVQALDLRGICVSHGAACASGSLEPSPVLLAMGVEHPRGALRVSLGPGSELADVERLLAELSELVGLLGDC